MKKLISILSNWFIGTTIPKGAVAVKPFNIEKYLGTWYEIARMDFRFERNFNNVTATYSFKKSGAIKVDNRGYNYKTKEWKKAIGKAKFVGDPTEARIEVSFFGPFYAPYNVIAIDSEYRYALVAGKNVKYLWILSREITIPEDIKQQYLALAQEIGFKTDALIWSEHTQV
jgi:apolipoprotein D and lipocalin family protein